MAAVGIVLSLGLTTQSPKPPTWDPDQPLIEWVKERRAMRQTGIAAGGTLLVGAASAGVAGGLLDGGTLLPVVAGGGALAALALGREFVAKEERQPPLAEDAFFEIRATSSKGNGLFALQPIAEGTYLYDYLGAELSEDEMFARYPEANGRYVAGITENLYIDGDPKYSELANAATRMNHAWTPKANVVWRKQKLGPNKAMHFYAIRDIAAGEELCYDYGEEYWTALGEDPL